MSRIRVNSIKPISGEIVSLSGSLIVTGDVTAEQFITEKVNTSIIYRSGSTLFGDSADDNHNFTGSVLVNGGLDSDLRITLGDDILLKKGINGGGLLEVLPTDTEGLHGIQLASETTSTNVAYSKYYDNKLSISEAGRVGDVGTNGQRIKLQDVYRVEAGVPTKYAGIEINHPESSRFRIGLGLEDDPALSFSVIGDSRFTGLLTITGSTDITGNTNIGGGLTVANDIVTSRNIKASTGILGIKGYADVSASIAHLDHFSSSFDNIYASEDELYTATASLDARIISLEEFSSSLDDHYATDAQLGIVSGTLASTITTNRVNAENDNTATNNTLISVSSSLATTINIVSSSVEGRLSTNANDITALENVDVAINNHINLISGSQQGLLSATGSYALKTDITGSFTLLSASIAQSWTNNHNEIHELEQDAYEFETSASIELHYVSKDKILSAMAASTSYNDFTGSLIALLS